MHNKKKIICFIIVLYLFVVILVLFVIIHKFTNKMLIEQNNLYSLVKFNLYFGFGNKVLPFLSLTTKRVCHHSSDYAE